MIRALVEPCWAAMRLPSMSLMPRILLPFLTRNCAPVTKKVMEKSTLSRRVRHGPGDQVHRARGEEGNASRRSGLLLLDLDGLVELLLDGGLDQLLNEVDGEADPLVLGVHVREGRRARARADDER